MVQKLWRCPLSGSSSVRHLGFMQIRPFSNNAVRYIKPHTKFERSSSNGSKVMALSVIQVKSVRHLEFMQIYAN
jgi:hypothetical protein